MAPGAVTVTVPPAPAVAVTWKLPFPVPEVGETVMFGWLAETLQLTPRLPLNVTVIDCGSVTKELLTPNFSDVRLRDMVVVAPDVAEIRRQQFLSYGSAVDHSHVQ